MGKKLNFCPSRGIRQGDPMSSYIFILCMEMLSRCINNLVDTHLWDSIKVTPKGPSLSRHFFADDLTLMGKVTRRNCSTILSCLNNFYNLSRQKINYSKFRVYFSTNCYKNDIVFVSTYLGIKSTTTFEKYLGFPIHNHHPKNRDFYNILDTLRTKLDSWKTNFLNIDLC